LKPKLPKKPTGRSLAVLLGDWTVEIVLPEGEKSLKGTASFRWLAKDRLLTMKSRVKNGPPTSLAVIGADDTSQALRSKAEPFKKSDACALEKIQGRTNVGN
jgi:hypothetical protein